MSTKKTTAKKAAKNPKAKVVDLAKWREDLSFTLPFSSPEKADEFRRFLKEHAQPGELNGDTLARLVEEKEDALRRLRRLIKKEKE